MSSAILPTAVPTVTLAYRAVPRLGLALGRLVRSVATGGSRIRALALLDEAYDRGVRLFDIDAPTEVALAGELLTEALGDRRDQVLYSGVAAATTPVGGRSRVPGLRDAVDAACAALRTDHLDVVHLHGADLRVGLSAQDRAETLQRYLAELVALRDEGSIVGIGLSHVTEHQLREAVPVGLSAVQNPYSVIRRDSEGTLRLAELHDIAWIPSFPVGGTGLGAGGPLIATSPAVREVAAELGATPAQVGVAWQLAHSAQTIVMSGARTSEELRADVVARELVLDTECMARLDDVRR